jgi:cellulose 1,4-beta-cellobiosidase
MTAHSCQPEGYSVCTGSDCGGAYSTSRYAGACDPEGCDFNPYRVGVKDFYGPGMMINTSKPFTVTTQFVGESSSLKAIKRFYVQDGKVFANPEPKTPGLSGNAMDQAWCDAQKVAFQDDVYSFGQHGGMAAVGKGMDAGMVLVMKIWDDYYTNMLWLDSTLPTDADPNKPGAVRGSCSVDSGVPLQVENQYPKASVTFSNSKYSFAL